MQNRYLIQLYTGAISKEDPIKFETITENPYNITVSGLCESRKHIVEMGKAIAVRLPSSYHHN